MSFQVTAPALHAISDKAPAPPERPPQRKRLTEGMLLAAVPVLLYAYGRAYEDGFARYFGYPRAAISLSFNTLLNSIPDLIVGFAAVALLILALPPFLLLIFGRIALMTYMISYGLDSSHEHALRIVCFIGAAMVLVMFLSEAWDVRLAWKKARAQPQTIINEPLTLERVYDDFGVTINPIFSAAFGLHPKKGFRTVVLFFLLLFGWTASRSLGEHHAAIQTDFLVRTGQPELVALRRYDTYWVCAVLDRQHHSVAPQFLFVTIPSDTTTWNYQRLGTLKPQFEPIQ